MSIISLKQAISYGINELNRSGINSARLDTEILLGFVLGFTREKLLMNQKLRIKNQEWEKYKTLIKKRSKHYPVAYLTGSKEFYGIDFQVNENVLVPRPETELLVENIINHCKGAIHCAQKKGVINHAPTILEIGTGSGCIALTLAKYLPKSRITATDVSEKALVVACGNRRNLKIKNVKLLKSNLLDKVKTKPDILIANLPYLTSKELKEVSISREPRLALKGGPDGLGIYRRLFQQVKERKWENMTIFIEIGDTQAKSLKKYILGLFSEAKIEIKKDLAGKDRVLMVEI